MPGVWAEKIIIKLVEQKYVYQEDAETEHYHAEVFTVRCFDNRYWKQFKHFIKDRGMGHIDTESVAGGAKIFASPEKDGDSDFMLRELQKSELLHHTKKVMLFTHSDCGAYGGLARFNGDKDAEFLFHEGELHRATEVVRDKFPHLKVAAYFMNQEGIVRIP